LQLYLFIKKETEIAKGCDEVLAKREMMGGMRRCWKLVVLGLLLGALGGMVLVRVGSPLAVVLLIVRLLRFMKV